MKDPHVLVAGAGAMGCLFGGLLAERGLRVTLLMRSEERASAIRERGLRIVGGGATAVFRSRSQPRREAWRRPISCWSSARRMRRAR
mgnify:CR=1 FL=1